MLNVSRSIRFLLLCVLVNLIGLASIVQAQDTPSTALSLITQSNEKAAIRRAGWQAFSRLNVGANVSFGDLIDPKGQPVRVLCPNLTERVVTTIGPVPCPKDRPILIESDAAVAGWQRGKPADVTIPFLISPRASKVLSTQPLIVWNTVDGASGYKVTVRGEGMEWSMQIDDGTTNHVIYPKTAPALKPNTPYSIEIATLDTDSRSSTEEDIPGLSFTVIDPKDAVPIQAAVTTIRAGVRNKQLADLTVAHYYEQNGLNADALQLLIGLVGDPLASSSSTKPTPIPAPDSVSMSPAVYVTFGDLSMKSKLDLYAKAAYSKALDLAGDDTESKANATTGLARLATDNDNQKTLATDAISYWQKLGAKKQIDALKQEFKLDSDS